MRQQEVFNHLYSLAFSLTGRKKTAIQMLQESVAFSGLSSELTDRNATEFDRLQLEAMEELMLKAYGQKGEDSPSKYYQNPDRIEQFAFFNLSPKQRFFLTRDKLYRMDFSPKYSIDKREYSEAIINLGMNLKLYTFQNQSRDQVKCAHTRSALIRLISKIDILNFVEHASECDSCTAFEKQFRLDMKVIEDAISVNFLSQDEIEDIIFSMKYPTNDVGYQALHKIKKFSKEIFQRFN